MTSLNGNWPVIVSEEPELQGWIYIPQAMCKTLKPTNPKDGILYLRVLDGETAYFGRPLPHRDPKSAHIQVSSKFSQQAAHFKNQPKIKVFGKLLLLSKVTITCEESFNESSARFSFINCLASNGMNVKICGTNFKISECIPVTTELALINNQTIIEFLHKRPGKPVSLAPASTNYLESGMIKNPSSSLDHAYNRLYEMIGYPILYKDMFQQCFLGLPKGVLLSGPPGVGKTFLVSRITIALDVPLIIINGPEILSSTFGESEENLRKCFADAESKASCSEKGVCVLFMDEVDSIASKRLEAENQTSVRVVTQLLTLMDGAKTKNRASVIVIAATNIPNSLDPALRRPGRFDREIIIQPPTLQERMAILKSFLREHGDIDIEAIARATIGYVAADLAALNREAFIKAISEGKEISSTIHFIEALKKVGPSLTREYRVDVDPHVNLDSIGGYEHVKHKLKQLIIQPLQDPIKYQRLGLKPPRGILLHGPPGCSKTTFAKALANSSGCTFYSINGAAVFSALVGESERIVRETFTNARMTAPSIIFIDEVDAIVGKRGDAGQDRDQVQERVLSTFLNEMDGIEAVQSVIVLGATNRKDCIDSALLRPGRFDYLLEIPLPNEDERLAILKVHASKMAIDQAVELSVIASVTDGWSGAQLKNVLQEAAMLALHNNLESITPDCILPFLPN